MKKGWENLTIKIGKIQSESNYNVYKNNNQQEGLKGKEKGKKRAEVSRVCGGGEKSRWPKCRARGGHQRSDLGPQRGTSRCCWLGVVVKRGGEDWQRDDRGARSWLCDMARAWVVYNDWVAVSGGACGATKAHDGWSRGDMGGPRW
ncbi:unnamed protein product [Sphenostylis stenocarpa]|uniref:Uncharacterized protein n=1 Tax=Sphenostylis stenocarpa TaxID=92480 RepID=A0AA86SQ16_9FABA|nr:unnamed protein product [Sphenostylis stenocarpa]